MILQPNPKLPRQFLPPSHERVCRLGASVANQMPVPVLPVKILLHPAAPYEAKHTTLHQLTPFFFSGPEKENKILRMQVAGNVGNPQPPTFDPTKIQVNIQPPAPWFRS